MSDNVTMRIWRGDPEGGEFTDYVLPNVEGEVVLDVIHRIQAGTARPASAGRARPKSTASPASCA